MPPLSLAPRALYEEVAELLRQRIFNRELEPGSWIDELKLAQAYGISRTPLREALKVLAAEGLVTMKVRRGAYVTEVSDKDLADVYHLLALLESDGAGVVAERASDEQLAELRALHAELEAAVTQRERFFAINERFHIRLLEIADNRWRQQMVSDLRKVMQLNRHNSLLKSGRIAESLAEHRAVVDALLARDAVQARERMQRHFHNGLDGGHEAHAVHQHDQEPVGRTTRVGKARRRHLGHDDQSRPSTQQAQQFGVHQAARNNGFFPHDQNHKRQHHSQGPQKHGPKPKTQHFLENRYKHPGVEFFHGASP
jgi:DNA-binding GntR family transcriptional regulator